MTGFLRKKRLRATTLGATILATAGLGLLGAMPTAAQDGLSVTPGAVSPDAPNDFTHLDIYYTRNNNTGAIYFSDRTFTFSTSSPSSFGPATYLVTDGPGSASDIVVNNQTLTTNPFDINVTETGNIATSLSRTLRSVNSISSTSNVITDKDIFVDPVGGTDVFGSGISPAVASTLDSNTFIILFSAIEEDPTINPFPHFPYPLGADFIGDPVISGKGTVSFGGASALSNTQTISGRNVWLNTTGDRSNTLTRLTNSSIDNTLTGSAFDRYVILEGVIGTNSPHSGVGISYTPASQTLDIANADIAIADFQNLDYSLIRTRITSSRIRTFQTDASPASTNADFEVTEVGFYSTAFGVSGNTIANLIPAAGSTALDIALANAQYTAGSTIDADITNSQLYLTSAAGNDGGSFLIDNAFFGAFSYPFTSTLTLTGDLHTTPVSTGTPAALLVQDSTNASRAVSYRAAVVNGDTRLIARAPSYTGTSFTQSNINYEALSQGLRGNFFLIPNSGFAFTGGNTTDLTIQQFINRTSALGYSINSTLTDPDTSMFRFVAGTTTLIDSTFNNSNLNFTSTAIGADAQFNLNFSGLPSASGIGLLTVDQQATGIQPVTTQANISGLDVGISADYVLDNSTVSIADTAATSSALLFSATNNISNLTNLGGAADYSPFAFLYSQDSGTAISNALLFNTQIGLFAADTTGAATSLAIQDTSLGANGGLNLATADFTGGGTFGTLLGTSVGLGTPFSASINQDTGLGRARAVIGGNSETQTPSFASKVGIFANGTTDFTATSFKATIERLNADAVAIANEAGILIPTTFTSAVSLVDGTITQFGAGNVFGTIGILRFGIMDVTNGIGTAAGTGQGLTIDQARARNAATQNQADISAGVITGTLGSAAGRVYTGIATQETGLGSNSSARALRFESGLDVNGGAVATTSDVNVTISNGGTSAAEAPTLSTDARGNVLNESIEGFNNGTTAASIEFGRGGGNSQTANGTVEAEIAGEDNAFVRGEINVGVNAAATDVGTGGALNLDIDNIGIAGSAVQNTRFTNVGDSTGFSGDIFSNTGQSVGNSAVTTSNVTDVNVGGFINASGTLGTVNLALNDVGAVSDAAGNVSNIAYGTVPVLGGNRTGIATQSALGNVTSNLSTTAGPVIVGGVISGANPVGGDFELTNAALLAQATGNRAGATFESVTSHAGIDAITASQIAGGNIAAQIQNATVGFTVPGFAAGGEIRIESVGIRARAVGNESVGRIGTPTP